MEGLFFCNLGHGISRACTVQVFARLMTSDFLPIQAKRELLFWKTCEQDALASGITVDVIFKAYQQKDAFLFADELRNYSALKTTYKDNTVRKCVKNYISIASKPRKQRGDAKKSTTKRKKSTSVSAPEKLEASFVVIQTAECGYEGRANIDSPLQGLITK